MTKVLVTGACGAVGPHIVGALLETGFDVHTLSLDAPPKGIWPSRVGVSQGDVMDEVIVQHAMQGVDMVIHLAALLHILDPLTTSRWKYERINVGGTAVVVNAAIKAGVKRIVFASTIAVYGPSGGQVLNEESVPAPNTPYGQTKLEAERIVLEARRGGGQALGTVLRFGAVYGGRIKGNYRRLVKELARGRFVPIGDGTNRRSLIYGKDLARAVVVAGLQPVAAGQIFNVTDGQFHRLKDIIAAMSSALGRTPPCYALPVKPVRWAAGLIEDAAKMLGYSSPVGRGMVDKYTEDIAVSGNKLRDLLGFTPQYDLECGWRETVDEMRQTGDL